MIADVTARYTLEGRILAPEKALEMECARKHFAALTRDDDKRDYAFTNERLQFAQSLEARYDDARDYLMFHILIGSTPRSASKQFDFFGKDSVRKFFTNAYQRYTGVPPR